MKLFYIIFESLLALCLTASFIWYKRKKSSLLYRGEANAVITKKTERQYKNSQNGEMQTYMLVTAEYAVGEKKYRFKGQILDPASIREDGTLRIMYDEAHPGRCVSADEIKDEKSAKIRWMLVPVLAIVVALFTTFMLTRAVIGAESIDLDLAEGAGSAVVFAGAVFEMLRMGKLNGDMKKMFLIPFAGIGAMIAAINAAEFDDHISGQGGMTAVYIITCAIYSVPAVWSIVKYIQLKKRMDISGETTGEVVEAVSCKRLIISEGETPFHQNITAQYSVNDEKLRAKVKFSDLGTEYVKGDRISIKYDESQPKKCIFSDLVKNKERTLKEWLYIPVLTVLTLLMSAAAMIPMCFGMSLRARFITIFLLIILIMLFAIPAVFYGIWKNREKTRSIKILKTVVGVLLTILMIYFLILTMLVSISVLRK